MSVATMNSYEKDIKLAMMAIKARKSRQKVLDDFKAVPLPELLLLLLPLLPTLLPTLIPKLRLKLRPKLKGKLLLLQGWPGCPGYLLPR